MCLRVRVVADSPHGLVAYLRKQFDQSNLDIVWSEQMGPCTRNRHDMCVIDLSNPPRNLMTICDVCKTPGSGAMLFLRGGESVPSELLHHCTSVGQRVLLSPAGSDDPYLRVYEVLAKWFHNLSATSIAKRLISDTPSLVPAFDLIEAVLERPWEIRRPRDLFEHIGLPAAEIREVCRRVGVRRIEHLITLARWLAFEYLINQERLTHRRALYLVGVSDRSNFERQKRRASYLTSA